MVGIGGWRGDGLRRRRRSRGCRVSRGAARKHGGDQRRPSAPRWPRARAGKQAERLRACAGRLHKRHRWGDGETGSMAQVIPLPVRSPVELGGGARRVCRLWLPTYVSGRQPAIMRTLVLTEAVACRDRANQLWASAEPLPQTQLRPLRSADVHCLRQDRR